VLQRLDALDERRVLLVAGDCETEVGDGEPGVGHPAVGGDDAEVLLVGAAAAAEARQRRAAQLRDLGQPLVAADVGHRHRSLDAPPDLRLLEHEP
jgi:hypothetical protein